MIRQRTIVLFDEWLVDDVVIVHVCVQLVVVQVQLDGVVHRDEAEEVAWWPGAPVLAEVGEHIDVVPQKKELRAPEQDRERPSALAVPL